MALKIQILLTLVLLLCAQLIAAAENKIKVSASADGTVQLEQAPLVLKVRPKTMAWTNHNMYNYYLSINSCS